MAFTNHDSFTLIFLALITFFFATNAHQDSQTINPFCKTATDKFFCTALVKGANAWEEATTNAIQGTLETANRLKKIVDGLNAAMPNSVSKTSKESVFSTCSESYQSLLDNLDGALNDLKTGDNASLNNKLSSASFSDCTDALKQFHVASPLASFNDQLLKFVDHCLAVSRQV